jgi:hypothetical protein
LRCSLIGEGRSGWNQEVVIVLAKGRRRLRGGRAERRVAGWRSDDGDSVIVAADLKRELVLGE